ncbi:Si-specific NAD(P)(+) transhydrogenase [Rhizobium sp. LjRoot98]|uniref:Si-specific NAD(P)(+) transhydrogenase n=1 Tax=unclassified Rhizobium TaxID=2613769 RepID=UPI00071620D7|nr:MULTISPECIES: Si-specific NAD(P)(+) transhydrogenase [unclassified Rhizobium]KQV31081.1 pyridine nucleotide-disulfide oxidoreductase [Rhizobium sp. Root1204]KQY10911.1 pyridine nucleotide-disulfide oxidoreductase [Rhizobium sp. Root1334]KRC05155.1 pyridine nucleotide-disulfide oxidoreductase [Rhizobium sp. Root73]
MNQYDLVVVGSGPAGRRAAIQAAKLGKKVLVIEQGKRVGGVSVHTGTIPSKTLRETALNLTGWRERGFYGRAYRVKEEISAEDLRRRLLITLDHEVEVLEHQFARNRVQHMRGKASFVDSQTMQIVKEDGETIQVSATSILLAVGTKPFRPDYIPFDGKTVLDSDELLEIEDLPRSMAVIGAGVIGIEYATIFSALDTQVTLIDPKATMLDFIDKEIVEDFTYQLRDRNMKLHLGQKAEKVERLPDGKCSIKLDSGRIIICEMVLFAAGRMGATDSLNLEAAGLQADSRGRLSVNPETFQTSVPNIYAAGDVVGFPSLASTSMEQGRIAARVAVGAIAKEPPKFFPYGIYAVPEISTCGLTEEEVKERGIPYECGIARFRETSRGHIMGLDSGLLKLIFSLKTRRLLGVHIVGEGATELVHIGQAVLNLKGTVEYFVENTFNYPTLAEAYKIAGLDAGNRMGEITPKV